MEHLETLFKHKNWFVQLNKNTSQYEPYLSKKLALQYFASSGDFYNDNGVLKYDGREGGSYRMTQQENEYFKNLLIEIKKAEDEAQKYIPILKSELSENNKAVKKHFIFKNMLVTAQVWFNSEYTSIHVSFIDYIKAHGGETKELLKTLYEDAKTPLKETDEKEEFKNLINMFLDWKNNFLTVVKFAEYYNLTIEKANLMIDKGRELNKKQAIEKQNFVIN